jgi:DUF1009 family protein
MIIGLIAGKGELPKVFKKEAEEKGNKVLVFGVKGITEMESHYTLPIGQVGKLIKILERENVQGLVMLGKFEHNIIFSQILNIDLTGLSILRRAKDKMPQSIISAFIDTLEEKGFEFIDPRPYLGRLLAGEGTLTKIKPSVEAMEDGVFGFPLAKRIATMDIGQTLVVKDKAVVAVEAMEGTQKTIERAGKIAGKGTRIIKVAREKQDFRIDVPGVGLDTLRAMKRAGADALFLEAGKVFVIDGEIFFREAERLKIPVYGM